MNNETLLKYNQEGFIPGPGESETQFLERVSFCQNLDPNLEEFPSKTFETFQEMGERVQEELGFTLPWVPIFYSNKDLALWHGGCAWIFQKEEGGPKGAFFQLRKGFSTKNRVFGYSKEEILVHEAVHVGRMAFEEPRYEEVLAYRTSKNLFRRCLGPIFSKPSEALLFFLSILLSFFYFPLILIPSLLLVAGCLRLALKHHRLESTFKKLIDLTGSKRLANQLLYRLTDKEIDSFGKFPLGKIKALIYSEQTQSLRQQLLRALAFKEEV